MKNSKKRSLFFLFLGIFFIVLDFLFKQYIIHNIPLMAKSSSKFPYGGIGVFSGVFSGIDFSINHVVNKGGAWGLLASYSSFLIYLRLIIIGCLTVFLFFLNKQKMRTFPLLLILSGAIGNVIDCFYYGHVVDMFLFNIYGYFFPLFNLADSMIFLGVFFLFMQGLFSKNKKKQVSVS